MPKGSAKGPGASISVNLSLPVKATYHNLPVQIKADSCANKRWSFGLSALLEEGQKV